MKYGTFFFRVWGLLIMSTGNLDLKILLHLDAVVDFLWYDQNVLFAVAILTNPSAVSRRPSVRTARHERKLHRVSRFPRAGNIA